MKRTVLTLIAVMVPMLMSAQKWSASVNAMDGLDFGTLNAEVSMAAARHITVNASARVNPWTYRSGDPERQLQNRHQTYAVGVRWWPWNILSGWWGSLKAQYQEYNRGGILSKATEEGDAFGAAFSTGYSLMLHRNINLDLGLGLWGGWKSYRRYGCPKCGKVTGSGSTWFLRPNELIIALTFTF